MSQRSRVPGGPNELSVAVSERRSAGSEILDLTESNPTRVGLVATEAALAPLLDARSLRYDPSPFGVDVARSAVANDWRERGVPVDSSRIALTASTSEAYGHCFKLFCDPGDEVLAPAPSYPLFEELARYEGVRLVPYPVVYDGAWHVDGHAARRAMTPRTRAVLVVSPNNPTGSVATPAELEDLAALGCPLIVDEVFATYPLDAELTSSCLAKLDAPMVVLDGLSKRAGLPQMKIAWMTLGGPADFVRDASHRLELLLDAYLSVATPAQYALPAWLSSSAELHGRIHERLRENVTALRRTLGGTAATVPRIEAGWYAMVRLPNVFSEEQWTLGLLRDHGVHAHPGWFYETSSGPWVVVSLLTPVAVFREGIRRLVVMLDAAGR